VLPSETYQIVIFNNGSSDNTANILQKYEACMDNLLCIHSAENLGFGKAINLAMKQCGSEIIMILNNDIKFGHMSENEIKTWPDNFLNLKPMIFAGPTIGLVDRNFNFVYETNDLSKSHNYMSGWCLSAHKKTWDAMYLKDSDGPFDSKSFFVYFEDTDLGFRAIRQNIQFMQIDVAPIHIGQVTSSLINTGKLYKASKRAFEKKWKKKYQIRQ